jgi:hypothetical protein
MSAKVSSVPDAQAKRRAAQCRRSHPKAKSRRRRSGTVSPIQAEELLPGMIQPTKARPSRNVNFMRRLNAIKSLIIAKLNNLLFFVTQRSDEFIKTSPRRIRITPGISGRDFAERNLVIIFFNPSVIERVSHYHPQIRFGI